MVPKKIKWYQKENQDMSATIPSLDTMRAEERGKDGEIEPFKTSNVFCQQHPIAMRLFSLPFSLPLHTFKYAEEMTVFCGRLTEVKRKAIYVGVLVLVRGISTLEAVPDTLPLTEERETEENNISAKKRMNAGRIKFLIYSVLFTHTHTHTHTHTYTNCQITYARARRTPKQRRAIFFPFY